MAGLVLDEWQQHVLRASLAFDADDLFAASEMCLCVPRQNGKGSILEARELAGLFLLREGLILHSAHEFKTAKEGYLRVRSLIENTPVLAKQVKSFKSSNEDVSIELWPNKAEKAKKKNGPRLRFVARSKGSGRGFSGDCVLLDEAYELPQETLSALLPTLSARPNPQVWYVSSTGMAESDVLRRKCEQGRAKSPRLGYFEWSARPDAALNDVDAWYEANPALGIRIRESYVAMEQGSMGDEQFARERLGLWASTDLDAALPGAAWKACADRESNPYGEVSIGIEVSRDKSRGEIWIAGRRAHDELAHIEYVSNGEGASGIGWIPEYVQMFIEKNPYKCVAIDSGSAAAELIAPLEDRGINVYKLGYRQVAVGAGQFETHVIEQQLRHLDDPTLNQSVANARKRYSNKTAEEEGGLWAWGLRYPTADITPLVAATHALHGLLSGPVAKKRTGRGWF